MTKDELAETIAQSIKELGFARIARAAVLDVFSTGEPVSFDIYERVKKFAASQNLTVENEEDFLVFNNAK
ncbi:MAG: hypothetical protein LC768_01230 [Acidobacteria bacterium]|nr:hypothetical protein [Acidobacteriota bacterium]MCA1636954.1 hypothetical protein [Acidobacteriota bacterium]